MDSIAVYHQKPRQLPAPFVAGAEKIDLSFNLELEHRVWLAKFKVDRHDRAATDPARLDWDGYEPELCLPDNWQPSWLSTKVGFGGRWAVDTLSQHRPDALVDRPMPGDRVVVYRSAPHADVVGIWLITGARYGRGGAVSYSHRPLLSCLEPVALRPQLRFDADLAQCWDQYFGRGSRGLGSFLALESAALSAVMRTVGVDPQLLCGPAARMPDCSMSNVAPGPEYRPSTYLRTALSAEARVEARALAEAVDWLTDGAPVNGAETSPLYSDVETVASAAHGVILTARRHNEVAEVVSVGIDSPSLDDLVLCPTLVMEATLAASEGRDWSLIVTLDGMGKGRTLRFSAQAVATCFDPASGRVGTSS